MPRPKQSDPYKRVMVSLPQSLDVRLTLHLFDHARGKIRYAARSNLITRLVREYLDGLEENPTDG